MFLRTSENSGSTAVNRGVSIDMQKITEFALDAAAGSREKLAGLLLLVDELAALCLDAAPVAGEELAQFGPEEFAHFADGPRGSHGAGQVVELLHGDVSPITSVAFVAAPSGGIELADLGRGARRGHGEAAHRTHLRPEAVKAAKQGVHGHVAAQKSRMHEVARRTFNTASRGIKIVAQLVLLRNLRLQCKSLLPLHIWVQKIAIISFVTSPRL